MIPFYSRARIEPYRNEALFIGIIIPLLFRILNVSVSVTKVRQFKIRE